MEAEHSDVEGLAPTSPTYALKVWLEQHPNAMVAAVGDRGQPVPVPDDLPLLPTHRIDDRSFLSLVAPEEVTKVVETFKDALRLGIAVTRLRVVDGHWVSLHYADVRPQYGVILRLVLPVDYDGGTDEVDPAELLETTPRLAVIEKDDLATIRAIDAATTSLLGWSPDDMVGRPSLDFIHPDDQARAIDNWMEMMGRGVRHAVRLRYRTKDGSWRWMETSNEITGREREDGSRRIVGQVIDISEEMAAADALRYSEAVLRRMAETVPVGLAQLDTDRVVKYMNSTLQTLLEQHRAAGLQDMIDGLGPDDRGRLEAALIDAVERGLDRDVDILLPGSGSVPDRACRVAVRGLTDDALILGALLCVMDVTDLKAEAATDPLTGLHNRTSIFNVLRGALARPHAVGVVYMDIDRFKPVNDTFGHDAGDRVLTEVAVAVRGAVREGDAVGRVGGDEFVVVCPHVSSPDAVLEVAHRLQAAAVDVLERSGYAIVPGASVGVAWSEPSQLDAEEMVRRADAAMYAAKRCSSARPMLWTLAAV